MKHVKFNILID